MNCEWVYCKYTNLYEVETSRRKSRKVIWLVKSHSWQRVSSSVRWYIELPVDVPPTPAQRKSVPGTVQYKYRIRTPVNWKNGIKKLLACHTRYEYGRQRFCLKKPVSSRLAMHIWKSLMVLAVGTSLLWFYHWSYRCKCSTSNALSLKQWIVPPQTFFPPFHNETILIHSFSLSHWVSLACASCSSLIHGHISFILILSNQDCLLRPVGFYFLGGHPRPVETNIGVGGGERFVVLLYRPPLIV
jgi:hypothetical protein